MQSLTKKYNEKVNKHWFVHATEERGKLGVATVHLGLGSHLENIKSSKSDERSEFMYEN